MTEPPGSTPNNTFPRPIQSLTLDPLFTAFKKLINANAKIQIGLTLSMAHTLTVKYQITLAELIDELAG